MLNRQWITLLCCREKLETFLILSSRKYRVTVDREESLELWLQENYSIYQYSNFKIEKCVLSEIFSFYLGHHHWKWMIDLLEGFLTSVFFLLSLQVRNLGHFILITFLHEKKNPDRSFQTNLSLNLHKFSTLDCCGFS